MSKVNGNDSTVSRVLVLFSPELASFGERGLLWAQSLANDMDEPVDFGIAYGDMVVNALAPDNDGVVSLVCVTPDTPTDAPMSAAEFVWDDDGRPAWGQMWEGFCELALFGGPPHRGTDSAIIGIEAARPLDADSDVLAEIRRGIFETTGMFSEPADPGWLAVSCDSPRMAAWMAASIILENVEARCADERLLLPVSETYTLRDEIKSTITVVAKVHHYWMEHVAARA